MLRPPANSLHPRNDVSDVRRTHVATPRDVRAQASAALSARARLQSDHPPDALATEALGGPHEKLEAATAAAGMSRDPKKGELSELRRRLERLRRDEPSKASGEDYPEGGDEEGYSVSFGGGGGGGLVGDGPAAGAVLTGVVGWRQRHEEAFSEVRVRNGK